MSDRLPLGEISEKDLSIERSETIPSRWDVNPYVHELDTQCLCAHEWQCVGHVTRIQIYTYVVLASWIFYAMSAGVVMILRKRLPDAPRPYKTWG